MNPENPGSRTSLSSMESGAYVIPSDKYTSKAESGNTEELNVYKCNSQCLTINCLDKSYTKSEALLHNSVLSVEELTKALICFTCRINNADYKGLSEVI